jgi:flagellar biosynthetic protein FliQ
MGRNALMVGLEVALPILAFGLIVGLLVSIFQAVTQIQEMTLTFVPKILAVAAAVAIFGKWMLTVLLNYFSNILVSLPDWVYYDIVR